MVERIAPQNAAWTAVDDYVAGHLLGEDPPLAATLAATATAGLPDIEVSPTHGRMLQLLARMTGARRILEIGTLGGYSTICLARALPEDGRLVTLEIDPRHAEVARENLRNAGVADRVELIVGPALETLPALEGPFDFVFIDADKPSNTAYLREAIRLSRPGTTILVDNVVREGGVLDAESGDDRIQGTRALFEAVAAEPRLTATAVQTVGMKRWDGFLLALVDA
ncbi:MAG: O-methyltransferase [Alphaproteobacteria bacterium]|nr:O-methyltransferase [Alphaproteobacteria bacterium]